MLYEAKRSSTCRRVCAIGCALWLVACDSGGAATGGPCAPGTNACADAAMPANLDAGPSSTAPSDSGSASVARDAGSGRSDGAAGSGPSMLGDAMTHDANDARDAMSDAMPSPADAAVPADATCQICAAYAEPHLQAQLQVSELDALSGLASSRKNPGILFAHNDHNRPVIFALDLQGKLHARITLDKAPASDIEDIAVGPCPGGQCVYLADIGDNAVTRSEYAVLRIAEPSVASSAGTNATTVSFERFRFNYEDGSHNAEGLMVAPSGTLYVVTKLAEGGTSAVYRLPDALSTSAINRATKVAQLPIPASGDMPATAAAAHPCGLGFLVRTNNRVYEFRIAAGAAFESAFTVTPTVVAMPAEPQSEGIDYLADGRGFVSSGEGASAPIYQTSCK